ncbi:MAG TPA: hypothetical protein VGW38_06055, partial [Chloroflexota bacterium]|nr:hypothetical protein [Chloroflexota bacterium]
YLFGPAPSRLATYAVEGRTGAAVRVGAAVRAKPRGHSPHRQPQRPEQCWTDGSAGPIPRPADMPEAQYHTDFPDHYDVFTGVVVIPPQGDVVFCEELAIPGMRAKRSRPVRRPSCGVEAMPVIGGISPPPNYGSTATTHASFLAHRRQGGLHDVTILPGGYSEFFEQP